MPDATLARSPRLSRRRIARSSALLAALLLAGGVALHAGDAPAPRSWSDPSSWGGLPPAAGSNVYIPPGQTFILDVAATPALRKLTVDGILVVADTQDVSIRASGIAVEGAGRLEVGSAAQPFRHRCTITLTGDGSAAGGDKLLGVTGSEASLELHGASAGRDWLRLAATAPAGARAIVLDGAPRWRPGARIVIASTDFEPLHAEERAVTGVAAGGLVTLDAPLRYTHCGVAVGGEPGGGSGKAATPAAPAKAAAEAGVPERAEVGLLDRDIVAQGDAPSETTHVGGQIVLTRGAAAQIEGVALRRMGQAGRMGRYPLHFHLDGAAGGDSYVRSCSFAHCYNRCLVLHGTSGVEIASNVAYDTIGSCYFLEDGSERRNRLIGNLGLVTRAAAAGAALLPSDLQPATYWIANPDNVVIGNAAAGSQGSGFWYDLPERPTGLAQSARLRPRRQPLGVFRGNTAHSDVADGLFVDNGPNPPGVTGPPVYAPRRPDGSPATAVFAEFTAYKNRRRTPRSTAA